MDALIVSHNKQLITFLSAQLSNKSLNVLISADNDAALALIRRHKPLLVFAETQGNNIDALKLFRAVEKKHPELSLIALSEVFNTKEALSLLRRGVADYIAVPLHGHEALLQKAIDRALVKGKRIAKYVNKHEQLARRHSNLSKDLLQLQEDHEAGRYVQLKLFPKTPMIFGTFEFSHQITPSLYLSGDFIEYFAVNDSQVLFYFADVSGHGASSAFITILLKLSAQRWLAELKLREESFSPKTFISHMNKEMISVQLGKHMSLFCGLLDMKSNTLAYSLAAHYPPPILRNAGEFSTLKETALPVGVFADAEYPEKTINLYDDFKLFLFSDGLMEVLPGSSLIKKEKDLLQLCESQGQDLDKLTSALALDKLTEVPDDIAVFMIKNMAKS
jgi:phosphoserine phosphatase RsbU/P